MWMAGCGGADAGQMAWDPSDVGSGGTAASTSGSAASVGTSSTEPDSTGGLADDDDDPSAADSTGEPESYDCTPWSTPFIGAPCTDDSDCGYEAGQCIREDQGFPCGTCSTPCEQLCPDLDGAPETFCIDGADVEIDSAGYCISKCDPSLLDGNGCRDGYACRVLSRFEDPGASAGVCIPIDLVDGEAETACQQTLLELGAVFTPAPAGPESPAGFPGLVCEIEDPVLLYGPINGVGLRYVESQTDGPVLVGCETAVSIVGSAAVAQMLGADEIIHIGTYNCRVIAGTSTLSEHGLGRAIDIYGFTLRSGEEVSVLDDWEDGNPDPVTPPGQLLRSFTDQIWAMSLWNIVLTPEFNAAHDNHFHIDRTPGGNTYD